MKKILGISSLVVLILFIFFGSSAGQNSEIDVDKEIGKVMDKIVKELEKSGLKGLRYAIVEDAERLSGLYKIREFAKHLKNERLNQEINWFIEATEQSIISALKTIRSLDFQLRKLEQELKKLLKQRKRQMMKKKKFWDI